jgi:hypothetical protein
MSLLSVATIKEEEEEEFTVLFLESYLGFSGLIYELNQQLISNYI